MDRRFKLREKTSQSHAALEGLIGAFDTIGDYHRYLRGMHSFRIPLEAWLSSLTWPPVFGNWRPVMIGAALSADLADFSLQPHSMMDDFTLSPDPDSVFGTLYVLEGSMLGAKLLSNRARQLGLSESFGARHLGLQTSTPANWQMFLAVLEDSAQFNVDDASHAANRAFHVARSAFSNTMEA
ncbi:biliverdin-producing heme oxygenase [Bradyrhizobium sp. McL0616]|uniref:biliverdin-producing heme oxygenase n=1 Tax=Bradyrhizobium sp. McL0616 TaxID=3415674 RepID=UPI003CF52BFE